MIESKNTKTLTNKINSTSILITLFIAMLFFIPLNVLAQYKVGSKAPNFTLNTFDNKQYQLEQFLNKQEHLILFFIDSDEESSFGKLMDLVSFINDYQPRESYQIVSIMKAGKNTDSSLVLLNDLKEKTRVNLINLLDKDEEVVLDYKIENYPSVLLLRSDLHIRKAYDRRFTPRQEESMYQYLRFIFTSKKGKDSGNGCDDGVCPPPPGFE